MVVTDGKNHNHVVNEMPTTHLAIIICPAMSRLNLRLTYSVKGLTKINTVQPFIFEGLNFRVFHRF